MSWLFSLRNIENVQIIPYWLPPLSSHFPCFIPYTSLSLPPSEYPPYYILSYYTSLSLSPSIIPYFLWYLHLSLFLSLSFYRLLSLFCVSLSLSFFLKSSILFYLPPILCDFLIELYITFFHFSFSLSLFRSLFPCFLIYSKLIHVLYSLSCYLLFKIFLSPFSF